MDYLLELANSGLVREVAETALQSPILQGVVLDIDQYWLRTWHIHTRSPAQLDAWERSFGPWWMLNPYEGWEGLDPTTTYTLFPQPLSRSDLKWRPRSWEHYSELFGFKPDQPPFVIKLYLRPAESSNEGPPPSFSGYPIRVIVETRPVAELYSNSRTYVRPIVGGISIGEGTSPAGTLGGVVHDESGSRFGVTCAHVIKAASLSVDQPARIDGTRKQSAIGISSNVSTLIPNADKVCNPWASGVTLNEVDLALVKLIDGVYSKPEVLDVGLIRSITPRAHVSPGQTVEMTGRSSGHKLLKLGGLAVTFRLYGGGRFYCFRNLFELRATSMWQLVRSSPVNSGDSGAWICNATASGFGWCGMVIGGDRVSGYAVFGETLANWWRQQGLCLEI